MVKICSVCGEEKDLSEFYHHTHNQKENSCESACVDCSRAIDRERYRENKEKINARKRELYQQNKEKHRKRVRDYYSGHKEQKSEYNRAYCKEYNQRPEVKEKAREKRKEKYHTNPEYKLRRNVSSSINQALKSNNSKKEGSVLQYLPFTIQELKAHLESLFEPWMCWENHGKYNPNVLTWQIDHIIPHSSFCYKNMNCDEFKKCWSLENLRPLETIENTKKGHKISP